MGALRGGVTISLAEEIAHHMEAPKNKDFYAGFVLMALLRNHQDQIHKGEINIHSRRGVRSLLNDVWEWAELLDDYRPVEYQEKKN